MEENSVFSPHNMELCLRGRETRNFSDSLVLKVPTQWPLAPLVEAPFDAILVI
jgi:hypothetical protein